MARDWTLPETLSRMLERQVEAEKSGVWKGQFDTFIHAAKVAEVDDDTIVKACLDADLPFGGMIYQWVQVEGGEEYLRDELTKANDFTILFADGVRVLPENLQQMLRQEGDGASLFKAFLVAARTANVADDVVVGACANAEYGGAIGQYVADKGGRDFVKRTIDRYRKQTRGWTLPNGHPAEHWLAQQGDANEELFELFIDAMRRANVAAETIVRACLEADPSNGGGGKIYKHVIANGGEEYVKRYIARILNESARRDQKQIIPLIRTDANTDEHWRTIEKILLKKKLPVFVRGGRLVQPLWHWEKNGDRSVLSLKLENYNAEQLTDMVQHHAARFQLWDNRKKGWDDIDPPRNIINRGLGLHHYSLHHSIGVITSPTLRPKDLSLITEQKYDEETQLWYMPSGDITLPPIPEHPTRGDATEALKFLSALFDGFPFEGETDETKVSVSRSAALAALLTIACRAALGNTVPLFVVTAPNPRTGKTYLIDLICFAATGHVAVYVAGAEKKEEIEKRIETAAMSGRPVLHLNNLPNGMVVESDRLSELATEGKVNIRKLGRHEEGICDCRATTGFLNGNNILLTKDLVPRSVPIRLDAGENPEEREFEFDPMEMARENRGRVLAAIFTILWAFRDAGYPEQKVTHVAGFPEEKVTRVAGFEDWSKKIQHALIWLDQPDPWGLMKEMQAIDPAQENLARVIEVLKKYSKPEVKSFTTADAYKLAERKETERQTAMTVYKRPDLRDIMTDDWGKVNSQHFGRMVLMKHRDRPVNGWMIEVVPRKKHGNAFRLKGPNGEIMALDGKADEIPMQGEATATDREEPF